MDSRIDPSTGDYDGTRCTDLSNAIYLRVTVPRGSYWADPTFGRRRRERLKDLERYKVLIVQDVREALQPLIDSKRASRIDIATEWRHNQRLYLSAQAYQSGQQVGAFEDYVKVE